MGRISIPGGQVFVKGSLLDCILPHEAFHSTDNNFHDSKVFSDAYNQDTCVPSSYANGSPAENFAELGTWVHYEMNGLPTKPWLKKDISCMENQLAVVKAEVENYADLRSSSCGPRGLDDEFLDPSNRGKGTTNLTIYPASPIMSRIAQRSKVEHQRSVSSRPME